MAYDRYLDDTDWAIGGPPGALVGGVLGLIGSGLTGWLQAKQAEEDRKAAQRRYDTELAESTRRWEADQAWTQKRYKLDRATYLNNLKTSNENMDNYYNERNYSRQQDWNGQLQGILKSDGLRNKYLETWGK